MASGLDRKLSMVVDYLNKSPFGTGIIGGLQESGIDYIKEQIKEMKLPYNISETMEIDGQDRLKYTLRITKNNNIITE